jgi:hypothetical protein
LASPKKVFATDHTSSKTPRRTALDHNRQTTPLGQQSTGNNLLFDPLISRSASCACLLERLETKLKGLPYLARISVYFLLYCCVICMFFGDRTGGLRKTILSPPMPLWSSNLKSKRQFSFFYFPQPRERERLLIRRLRWGRENGGKNVWCLTQMPVIIILHLETFYLLVFSSTSRHWIFEFSASPRLGRWIVWALEIPHFLLMGFIYINVQHKHAFSGEQ